MQKILIFGNSGSGKSTLAKSLCEHNDLSHLDLDSLAWKTTPIPERKSLDESSDDILQFIQANKSWVIEGCYTDLLEIASPYSTEILFMNLSIAECISNAKNRPWEPHKYKSKEAQDKNLEMLIDWISQYDQRDDTFSQKSHQLFYKDYVGKKRMITQNEDLS